MDPVLYKAVVSGNLSCFESLINNDRHKLLQVTTDQQNTILHIATKCREKHIAEKIIDSCPSLMHETNAKGDSALHIAGRLGHLGIAKLLINHAKVEEEVETQKNLLRMVNLKGDTALHESVKNRHIEVVKLLVDEDQILATITNNAGESPIFIAAERNFYEIAIHINKSSATCPSPYRGRNGMNVLHAATIREETSKFSCFDLWNINLVFFCFIILAVNQTRQIFTCDLQHPGVCAWAVCVCFFCLHCQRFGVSGAQVISISAFEFLIKFLLHEQFQINKTKGISTDNRQSKFLNELLKKNSSTIAEADNFGRVPLHYAACVGNSQAVELLLDMDISLADAKDKEGMSALHIAAKTGQYDVIRKLIEKCPHITELFDNNRRTALHVAAERGNSSTILMLLSLPIFDDLINAQDVDGNTPFHLAARHENRNAILALAANPRIDKWAINNEGFNPLDIAESKDLAV